MNKVDFTLKNGRVERVHPKIAELLQRKGKGTYQTTALAQSPQRAVMTPPAVPNPSAAEPVVVVTQTVETPAPEAVDLAAMSVDELREYAKRQGVQVHHRAGTEKILEAIEKKAEE